VGLVARPSAVRRDIALPVIIKTVAAPPEILRATPQDEVLALRRRMKCWRYAAG
jgi:hypothetical protein